VEKEVKSKSGEIFGGKTHRKTHESADKRGGGKETRNPDGQPIRKKGGSRRVMTYGNRPNPIKRRGGKTL